MNTVPGILRTHTFCDYVQYICTPVKSISQTIHTIAVVVFKHIQQMYHSVSMKIQQFFISIQKKTTPASLKSHGGIYNLQHTCYANASLQSLLSISHIKTKILHDSSDFAKMCQQILQGNNDVTQTEDFANELYKQYELQGWTKPINQFASVDEFIRSILAQLLQLPSLKYVKASKDKPRSEYCISIVQTKDYPLASTNAIKEVFTTNYKATDEPLIRIVNDLDFLIIDLGRDTSKTTIHIPSELTIPIFSDNGDNKTIVAHNTYRLYSAVLHKNEQHFISVQKKPTCWIKYDDMPKCTPKISTLTEKEAQIELDKDGSFLFYEKIRAE